jgi:hypothetical protein
MRTLSWDIYSLLFLPFIWKAKSQDSIFLCSLGPERIKASTGEALGKTGTFVAKAAMVTKLGGIMV